MKHLGTPKVSSSFLSIIWRSLSLFVTRRQGNTDKINEHSSMKTLTKTQLYILVSGRLHYLHEVGTILSPHLNHNSVSDTSVGFLAFLYPSIHVLYTNKGHSFFHKMFKISQLYFPTLFHLTASDKISLFYLSNHSSRVTVKQYRCKGKGRPTKCLCSYRGEAEI
jgi:hypothetical protein